ncbi:hypothetical protein [Thiohalorhabdus methylotrophus]|uniref:Uncharacterized protein n=1 Tax=Thiohalorhabdus methylotrophus TaxID=3242694 RepID=A0ABV4TU98_9GAMM
MEPRNLPQIPEEFMDLVRRLRFTREGIGEDVDPHSEEAAQQSTGPPILCNRFELDKERAEQLQAFFQDYAGRILEKPADPTRGRMILMPRKFHPVDGDYYVEFEALSFL